MTATVFAPPIAALEFVNDALSGIASALEIPVHVGALILLLVLALELGRSATETWRRARPRRARLYEVAVRALTDPAQGAALARMAPSPLSERAVLDLAAAASTGRPDAYEHALADYELGVQRRLDRTRMLVRAGPALGLMGTLIPLAPGLGALGRGDFATLAGDLKVAFAATVIGILVGTAAFTLTLIRTRVYTEDLAALERAVSVVVPGALATPTAPPPAPAPAAPHQRITQSIGEHGA